MKKILIYLYGKKKLHMLFILWLGGEGVLMRHMRDSYTIFIEKLEWKKSF